MASTLESAAVIRVVDKGPGQLWGFYPAWVWYQLQAFLVSQGYNRSSSAFSDVLASLC